MSATDPLREDETGRPPHTNDADTPSPLPLEDDLAPATDADDLFVKVQLLEQELERTKDQLMRALAEAENTRKRSLREREDAAKFAIAGFSKDIVSVADNLRRALCAIPEALAQSLPEIKSLIGGIEATERELLRSFEKNGIQKIDPLDLPFDPHFHEVMFETVIPGKPSGTVIQVLEAGYVLNGRALRPARVGVSKVDGTPPTHSVDTQV